VEALSTPEIRGAIHLDCPSCFSGSVYRDGRGGFECTDCSQRFLVHETHPNDRYGGPEHVGGPLRLWERPLSPLGLAAFLGAFCVVLWAVPVPYWSLLFLAMLVWEQLRRKR